MRQVVRTERQFFVCPSIGIILAHKFIRNIDNSVPSLAASVKLSSNKKPYNRTACSDSFYKSHLFAIAELLSYRMSKKSCPIFIVNLNQRPSTKFYAVFELNKIEKTTVCPGSSDPFYIVS